MTNKPDDNFTGPDEGGKRGENTQWADGYDRQTSEEMLRVDAAIQSPTAPAAGPNSDATAQTKDRRASRPDTRS